MATSSASPQTDLQSLDQELEQTVTLALDLAVNRHLAGQLQDAEDLYISILKIKPDQPDANHNMGLLAVQLQQPAAGLSYFEAAIEASPEQENYWISYIDALIQANQLSTAQQVLALGRQHGLQGAAVENLSIRLAIQPKITPKFKSEKFTKKKMSTKGIGKAPSANEMNTVVELHRQRRGPEVVILARALTRRFPLHGFGWKLLGAALQTLGRSDEAVQYMQKAAVLLPMDPETHSIYGVTLKDQGRLVEAEASLRQSLVLNPNYAIGHCNLGATLRDLGRFVEAEASLRQALELNPDHVEIHHNLALTLQNHGRLAEAEACLRQALTLKSSAKGVHEALGSLLQEQGRLTEAAEFYRTSLAIDANCAYVHSNLLFCLTLMKGITTEALFAEHCHFGEQFEGPLRAHWPEHRNLRDPERCLQIGFVSADFYNHAVASFIEPVLMHLGGNKKLCLHAYYNHFTQDSVTQRLHGYFTHWNSVVGLSDAALIKKIHADGIDILIDLSGHTSHNRLVTFAHKPAPIQVSWMGYPGTTGLQAMDYYLTDSFLLPPGQLNAQFTEKLVHLPANAPFLPSVDAPPVNTLPALVNSYVTFGSFHRMNKLSRPVIALWSQLLRTVPDSKMLLGAMPMDNCNETLIDWFAQEGIDRERLSFHPRSSIPAYLALHHQVDICLDAFPYAGGTTTLHALWMGVPTLTLAGTTVAGRTGACILGHVGLDSFIAHDEAAFVLQGLSLVSDPSSLANLRKTLRERCSQSAPGQPEIIANGLDSALRAMWQRWCKGLPAEPFEVNHASVKNKHNLTQEAKI